MDEFDIFDTETPDQVKRQMTQMRLRGETMPKVQATSISPAVLAQTAAPQPKRSGPMLPQATAQQQPSDPLMQQYQALTAQRKELDAEQQKAWATPDYEPTRQMGRDRALGSDMQMMNALYANESGSQYKPFAAQYLKQAASMREPMKVTGGQITESGEFFQDPGYEQELNAKRVDARMKQIDAMMQQNLSEQNRRQLQQERLELQQQMQQNMIDMQKSIAAQSSADRRWAAQLASDDRAAGRALQGGGKLSGEEAAAQGYLYRMRHSEAAMQDPELAGHAAPSGPEFAAGLLPYKIGLEASNMMRGPQRQQIYQAQEDWVRAKLRKESGAAIPPDEMEREIRTYFPSITDGPEVIAQKAQSRKAAERQMEMMGGTYKRELDTQYGGGQPQPQNPRMQGPPQPPAPAPVQQRVKSYYGN